MSSNLAGVYNFTVEQGSDFSLQINLTDSENDPIDLTGYTAKMQVRVRTSDSTAILTLTHSSGITLNSPDTGSFIIRISSTASSALIAGVYVYDLEIIDGSNIVTRLLKGTLTLDAEVTR